MTNVDEDTRVVRKKVADHYLIDAQGNKVDTEEEATGIGYKLLAVDQPFEYQVSLPQKALDAGLTIADFIGSAILLEAIFGCKTLATNESSQARNSLKGEASPAEQLEAVVQRFALVDSGTWVDRTRDGVGAKVDKAALAAAYVAVAAAAGHTRDEAEVLAKLEENPKFVTQLRQIAAVMNEYNKRVGRPARSLDDVLGAI